MHKTPQMPSKSLQGDHFSLEGIRRDTQIYIFPGNILEVNQFYVTIARTYQTDQNDLPDTLAKL